MVDNNGENKFKPRKPLRDFSNGGPKHFKSSSTTTTTTSQKMKSQFPKTPIPKNQQQKQENHEEIFVNNGDPLDRLLLVHSDISSLFRQIDQVVVKALKVNTTDNERIKEIKSFTSVLSDIHSSLKPWVPRLEKTLDLSHTELGTQTSNTCVDAPLVNDQDDDQSIDTPDPIKHASLVSPSPLVSWRATGCLEERGKQLFLLTPLIRPKTATSKSHAFSKLTTSEGITSNPNVIFPSFDTNEEPNNGAFKGAFESLEGTSNLRFKMPVVDLNTALTTPCLKKPPLKTNVLCENDDEINKTMDVKSHKSTPFPTIEKKLWESTDSESSSGEIPENLGLKYLELIGIKPSCMSKNESTALEASPMWIMSPPKCCTLLEPLVVKNPKDDTNLQQVDGTLDEKLRLARTESKTENQDKEDKKFCFQGNSRTNFPIIESTPLWKGSESTIQRSKRPAGENTLKRELWTRFEAASNDGFALKFGVSKDNNSQKGFLERLEEASFDESIAL